MVEKVVMPKLGATMEEGTIDSWLVEVGDEVEEGDPIAEIQTDKITMEIEAETTGVLLKQLYEQGDTVPVQKVIAYIGEAGENIDDLVVDEVATAGGKEVAEQETTVSELKEGASESTDQTDIRRTPIARRIAAENNVSLSDITGTGPLSRIQKVDVEKYIQQSKTKITPLAQKMASQEQIDITTIAGTGARGKIVKDDIIAHRPPIEVIDMPNDKRVPFKGMRKVIASWIADSFYSAPHVTLHSEINMTECVTLRKQLLPVIEEMEGVRVSYNEIIIKAVACTLKKNPTINISLENEQEIVHHENIHVGFAVAVPSGLVVPVLKHVDQKGLGTITQEAKSIAKQARDGLLTPDDMQGSTFTISNLGMYAVDGFTPIINQPNAAILGVGRIQEKPVMVNGVVEGHSMMSVSLSFDHRIIDGAPAAQFLTDLKNVLEQPYQLMV